MSKCTSAVKWEPKRERWYTTAQKDGQRKFFYSSLPGRKGQAEVKAKADAWLETGVNPSGERIEKLYADWYATLEQTTGTGNCRNVESRWRTRILPAIGKKRITSLTEQDLQNVVNKAFADDRARKRCNPSAPICGHSANTAGRASLPPSILRGCGCPPGRV